MSAIETYGTTHYISESGYITPDGKLLDFSGKKDGAPGLSRTIDHRAVCSLYDCESPSDAMIAFMNDGNIRVIPEFGGIDISVAPTTKQLATLQRYVNFFIGEVIIDISAPNGDILTSKEYDRGTRSSVILDYISKQF